MATAAQVAHYAGQAAAAQEMLASSLTLYPFVISADWYTPSGQRQFCIKVVEANGAPSGEDILPPDAELPRVEVIPAERFATMPMGRRRDYGREYTAWVTHRWTKAGRKFDSQDVERQVYGWQGRTWD